MIDEETKIMIDCQEIQRKWRPEIGDKCINRMTGDETTVTNIVGNTIEIVNNAGRRLLKFPKRCIFIPTCEWLQEKSELCWLEFDEEIRNLAIELNSDLDVSMLTPLGMKEFSKLITRLKLAIRAYMQIKYEKNWNNKWCKIEACRDDTER